MYTYILSFEEVWFANRQVFIDKVYVGVD